MFPVMLTIMAVGMLTIRGLKEQGRLGRFFGGVMIRDQAPSNTIQKIIAVKDAMRDVENMLQQVNVSVLKIRSILLSGNPQVYIMSYERFSYDVHSYMFFSWTSLFSDNN